MVFSLVALNKVASKRSCQSQNIAAWILFPASQDFSKISGELIATSEVILPATTSTMGR
jgi:hypothetical protein